MLDLASSRWLDLVQTLMDWTDQHCRSSHRLMRCRTLHAEMVASAALVEFNRSDFCKRTRSCSIISVPGSALTKRASGVSSGILVHQDYRAVLRRNELSAPDGHHPATTDFARRQRAIRTGAFHSERSRVSTSRPKLPTERVRAQRPHANRRRQRTRTSDSFD
jgi:hypothetical protein